jgi:hypothetical protein
LGAAHVALEQGALRPLSPAATRKTRAKVFATAFWRPSLCDARPSSCADACVAACPMPHAMEHVYHTHQESAASLPLSCVQGFLTRCVFASVPCVCLCVCDSRDAGSVRMEACGLLEFACGGRTWCHPGSVCCRGGCGHQRAPRAERLFHAGSAGADSPYCRALLHCLRQHYFFGLKPSTGNHKADAPRAMAYL